jgi:hypothetical protein
MDKTRATPPTRRAIPCWRGAEDCGAAAARGARLAHDEALAEFLCRVQAEIVDAANSLF